MAGRGRPTFMKRQREAAKERKRREKAERRVVRKSEKEPRELGCADEDPDIAGIIPGPQPRPFDDEMDCSWSDFEGWIRSAICGDFNWKVRPRDTRENRKLVIKSIEDSLRNADERFALTNSFIERLS